MRAVPALLVLLAGCIAAEPGQTTDNASQRKACTDLEGVSFQAINSPQLVAFVADDSEYSTYAETTDDGEQSIGLAQCISVSGINLIYLDGAIDHYAARADITTSQQSILQWTDGHWLYIY